MTQTMSQSATDLPVATLARETRCGIARYLADRRPYEDPYAFELFRRAIVQSDQDAWAALYDLYHALVRNWTLTALPVTSTRMLWRRWSMIPSPNSSGLPLRLGSASSPQRQSCSPTSKPAGTAWPRIMSGARARQAEEPVNELDHEIVLAGPAEEVMMQMQTDAIWEAIGAVVDEQERLVLQVICVLGWSARTLPRLYPKLFPTVQDVYRIKRNVLERLRRNRRLRAAYRNGRGAERKVLL